MKTMQRIMLGLVLLMGTGTLWAENWPHWRGPYCNGTTTEKNLPTAWSLTEGLAWTVKLPGCSAATPIVWEDRVFISCIDETKETLVALCYDRKHGDLLWSRTVAKGIRRDRKSTYAAPSPVTDGRMVAFFYSTGELVAFDLAGKELWQRNLHQDYGPFAYQWTFASSLTLEDNRLYVQILQRNVPVRGRGLSDRPNESYLLAVNPRTGDTLWRHIRPSKARAESLESFATPIPAKINGQKQILVVGGDVQTGHDPETGAELWRWGTWNPERITHWRHVPSPIVGQGVILICAPKRDPIYGLRVNGKGTLDDNAVIWKSDTYSKDITSDVPTPAYYDGDFFVLSDLRKILTRLDPKTGKPKWTVKTPGKKKYEASPLMADDKIYTIDHAGEVAIFDVANGKLINTIAMEKRTGGPEVRASIVASEGQLFIRTSRHLHCVDKIDN